MMTFLTKIKVLLKNNSLYIPDVVGVVFSEVEAEFSFVRASAAVEAKKRTSICILFLKSLVHDIDFLT